MLGCVCFLLQIVRTCFSSAKLLKTQQKNGREGDPVTVLGFSMLGECKSRKNSPSLELLLYMYILC